METILFQGDSITDWFRAKDREDAPGSNYVTMVAGELSCKYPLEYKFLNRGISGNRSIDILGRIKKDIIALNPDYISILIGVNDIWHDLEWGNGISPEKYEVYYNLIISELKEALPNIKIMIMEPFILKGYVGLQDWDGYNGGVRALAKIAKSLAEKHDLEFVPLQDKFDEATKIAPVEYWAHDGVHPTPAGHCIIKNAWIDAFEKNFR